MSRYAFPSVLIVALAFVASGLNKTSFSQEPRTDKVDLAKLNDSFRDKVLMVDAGPSNLMEGEGSSAVIGNASVLLIGDRYFIQGTAYYPKSSKNRWYEGSTVGIALDKVSQYWLWTPEQFEQYMKRLDEYDTGEADTQ